MATTQYKPQGRTRPALLKELLIEARSGGGRDSHLAKRRSARFAHNARMEISVVGEHETRLVGDLYNISSSGVAIRCRQRIEVDTYLRIRRWSPDTKYEWVEAVVRHCSRGVSGYLIGARFVEPIPDPDIDAATQPHWTPEAPRQPASKPPKAGWGVFPYVLGFILLAAAVGYLFFSS